MLHCFRLDYVLISESAALTRKRHQVLIRALKLNNIWTCWLGPVLSEDHLRLLDAAGMSSNLKSRGSQKLKSGKIGSTPIDNFVKPRYSKV